MASPLASVQKYISTSLPQTVLTPTQNGLPVFLKEDLFGKVFPTNCLFNATLEHCCDITIIHFGLHPTISKLRIFLLLSSIFASIRIFYIRWSKYWSFSCSINPSNEYSVLISFRIDWFDLAVKVTLKSLLQHHNSKASILRCSTFFSHIHT